MNVFGLFLSVAVLLPRTGNAQVYQFRTPSPMVTAAAADWQINSDPVVVNGLVYYPTRGFRFFDGERARLPVVPASSPSRRRSYSRRHRSRCRAHPFKRFAKQALAQFDRGRSGRKRMLYGSSVVSA